MFQNNWVAEQLVNDHQRNLMEKAEQARQARDAQQPLKVRKQRRMLAKLRAEMNNL